MVMQPAPPALWHRGSLSYTLQQLVQRAQGALDPEVAASLHEATGRVFIQEAYMNDLHVATSGRSINPDPYFVYNGYLTALSNLIRVLTLPGFEGTPRGQISRSMHMRLQNILTIVHSRGNDLTGLFRDPNMSRALADLAGFP